MTREEILESIKDLILSLRLGHIEDHNLKKRWKEKQSHIDAAMLIMTDEDKKWIDLEYKKWHKGKIEPLFDMKFPHL